MLSILELFGGIGGFTYGIEKAVGKSKYKVVGYYDIDKYATAVYNFNLKTEYYPIDIRRVSADDIPRHNLLCAGFPCQAFSIAGSRRGFEDTRGTLFFEIARILEAKKPAYFILENVRGLLSVQKGKTFKIILEILEELGYEYQWMVLNSRFFGVPQNRERVFIIGNLRGRRRPEILPFRKDGEEDNGVCKTEVARCLDATQYKGVSPRNYFERKMRNIIVHSLQPRSPNRPSLKYSSGGSGHLLRFDEIAYCLDTGVNQAVQIGMKLRRLTPIECERLQGFPDNWTQFGKFWSKDSRWETKMLSNTQRYRLLGNAVTTNVVSAIVGKMYSYIED